MVAFMLPGGLCHPSDDFGSEFQVLEIVVGYVCICYDECTTNGGAVV
jgi:hypothetical protein